MGTDKDYNDHCERRSAPAWALRATAAKVLHFTPYAESSATASPQLAASTGPSPLRSPLASPGFTCARGYPPGGPLTNVCSPVPKRKRSPKKSPKKNPQKKKKKKKKKKK